MNTEDVKRISTAKGGMDEVAKASEEARRLVARGMKYLRMAADLSAMANRRAQTLAFEFEGTPVEAIFAREAESAHKRSLVLRDVSRRARFAGKMRMAAVSDEIVGQLEASLEENPEFDDVDTLLNDQPTMDQRIAAMGEFI